MKSAWTVHRPRMVEVSNWIHSCDRSFISPQFEWIVGSLMSKLGASPHFFRTRSDPHTAQSTTEWQSHCASSQLFAPALNFIFSMSHTKPFDVNVVSHRAAYGGINWPFSDHVHVESTFSLCGPPWSEDRPSVWKTRLSPSRWNVKSLQIIWNGL